MKLNPQKTIEKPIYPIRDRSTINAVKRAVIAFGTSALLGLSACGASDSQIDASTSHQPSETPATQPFVVGEPLPSQPVEPVVTPVTQDDDLNIAGGRSSPRIDPEPVQDPPPPPPPPPVLPPLNNENPPSIRGGVRAPRLRNPEQQKPSVSGGGKELGNVRDLAISPNFQASREVVSPPDGIIQTLGGRSRS